MKVDGSGLTLILKIVQGFVGFRCHSTADALCYFCRINVETSGGAAWGRLLISVGENVDGSATYIMHHAASCESVALPNASVDLSQAPEWCCPLHSGHTVC